MKPRFPPSPLTPVLHSPTNSGTENGGEGLPARVIAKWHVKRELVPG